MTSRIVSIGIDPGANGAMCVLDVDTQKVVATQNFKTKNGTDKIIGLLHLVQREYFTRKVVIERVHSSPQMGVVSAFSFGENYGWWSGVLDAMHFSVVPTPPQVWMGALGCMTGGDKNVTKRKAAQWFPTAGVTHANADAILIAVYAARII